MPDEGEDRRSFEAMTASRGLDISEPEPNPSRKDNDMLSTIAIILVILWLLGLVTSTTMGGFIHVLLVIAVVVILLRVISGRKVL